MTSIGGNRPNQFNQARNIQRPNFSFSQVSVQNSQGIQRTVSSSFSRGIGRQQNIAAEQQLTSATPFSNRAQQAKGASKQGFMTQLSDLIQKGTQLLGKIKDTINQLKSLPSKIKGAFDSIKKGLKSGNLGGALQGAKGLAQTMGKGFNAIKDTMGLGGAQGKGGKTGGLFGGILDKIGGLFGGGGGKGGLGGLLGGLLGGKKGGLGGILGGLLGGGKKGGGGILGGIGKAIGGLFGGGKASGGKKGGGILGGIGKAIGSIFGGGGKKGGGGGIGGMIGSLFGGGGGIGKAIGGILGKIF